VSVGSLVHLMSFEGASAHLLEVTLADESPACGMQIGDLGLPREAAIVALVRRDHMIAPDTETTLFAGDEVVVLAEVDSESAITSILVGDTPPTGPAAVPTDDHGHAVARVSRPRGSDDAFASNSHKPAG
jgi:trk system potassium uptake protein TrkA